MLAFEKLYDYIKPGTDTYSEREAAAFRWYEVRYNSSIE